MLKIVFHNIVVNAISDGCADSFINRQPLFAKLLVVICENAIFIERPAPLLLALVHAIGKIVDVHDELQFV